ncbi:hypothetical protein DL770_008599 [Monosporascus sp. CRB-9-2]|nr:hypothetical protein DL770_008599 [Monosporascus sp. CRB-9-2]
MYNTRFKAWGPQFIKNMKKGRNSQFAPLRPSAGKRTRPRRLESKMLQSRGVLVLAPATTPPPATIRSPEQYRNVENVIHATGNYTLGLFEVLNWDLFTIDLPPGVPDLKLSWQYISDQCFSATELMTRDCRDDGRKTMNAVYDKLRAVMRFPHPEMMVKFWRICQTINAVESRLGPHHATVLHMWSNYLKQFEGQAMDRQTLRERYEILLQIVEMSNEPTGENTISTLHGFMYASHYNLNDRDLTIELATKLYARVQAMPYMQVKPYWCLPTQSFALAAKLLADLSRESGQLQECHTYLGDAVEILSVLAPLSF